jgi:hypothetical protein
MLNAFDSDANEHVFAVPVGDLGDRTPGGKRY